MARDPRKEGSRSKTRGKKGLPRRNAASGSAPKRARKSPAKGPKTTNLSKTTKVAKTAKVDRGAATALHRKLTEAQARQAATAEILKIIASSPSDVKPVFNAIVRTVLRVMRCDRAFIMRCAGGFYFLVARAARDGSFVELTSGSQPIDPEANFPSRAIVTGKTVYYSDRSLIDLPEHERLISEEFGVNSSLFLPLLRQDECIGVLALASKTTNAFNPSDIALAESFRDQALIAIENARLFHETNEALERQTATADILKVIASSPSNLPLVFDAIAHQANRLIGGYVTAVVLFKGDIAELAGFTPLNEMADARLRATFPRPIEDFALLELVRNGEAAQISDIETDARMPEQSRELARAAGFRSQLLTPLIGAPGPIGLIGVTRKEPGGFDAHHVSCCAPSPIKP